MIYTEEVHVIEMGCVGQCFTSKICSSLDVRCGALKKGSDMFTRKLLGALCACIFIELVRCEMLHLLVLGRNCWRSDAIMR